ncbi:hypothetical protein DUI87_32492 [Hirundo rustica rustica]|uniref:Uncharacterized protein n=1 Tax=Hirundo rustica rustica TaxID=333673 RepID=A0A3M0IRH3_HIRRU|nr:hypothetical protein DUI87_32492 [Hirundo rustica rustica]
MKKDRRRDGRSPFGPPGQLAKREEPGTGNDKEHWRVSIPAVGKGDVRVGVIWEKENRLGPPGDHKLRIADLGWGQNREDERQRKKLKISKDYLEGEEVTRKYLKPLDKP